MLFKRNLKKYLRNFFRSNLASSLVKRCMYGLFRPMENFLHRIPFGQLLRRLKHTFIHYHHYSYYSFNCEMKWGIVVVVTTHPSIKNVYDFWRRMWKLWSSSLQSLIIVWTQALESIGLKQILRRILIVENLFIMTL